MPDVEFRLEVVRGVPVVVAPEEIDVTNAGGLRSALLLAAARGDGDGRLIVDMTRTRFCDSNGLHTLLAAHRRAQSEGGQLLLVISGPTVRRVFTLTGIDRIIPSAASLDEALAETLAAADGRSGRRDDGAAARTMTVPDGLALDAELPGTLKRSPQEAQETFIRALARAVQVYGRGDQAYRAAYAELKQTFEKRGDHWIAKQPCPAGG